MLDRVSDENCDEADLVTKHFHKLSLDAPGYTPWFDTWMKLYLQTLPVVDHEFLRHSLGVIFVVSCMHCHQVHLLHSSLLFDVFVIDGRQYTSRRLFS